MCACDNDNLKECLCPHLSSYANACASKGIVIPYINKVDECRPQCPSDQEYQVCGNSCTRFV